MSDRGGFPPADGGTKAPDAIGRPRRLRVGGRPAADRGARESSRPAEGEHGFRGGPAGGGAWTCS